MHPQFRHTQAIYVMGSHSQQIRGGIPIMQKHHWDSMQRFLQKQPSHVMYLSFPVIQIKTYLTVSRKKYVGLENTWLLRV